jgi:hypothetical protein
VRKDCDPARSLGRRQSAAMPNAGVRALTRSHADKRRKPPVAGGFMERMMGLEPTTFCMASRRSSQLSYIRG